MGIIGALIVFLILFSLLIWLYRRQLVKETDFLKNIPVPTTALPFVGVAFDFKSTKEILDRFLSYTQQYGPTVTAKIGPFRQIVLTSDYKLVESVLSGTKIMTKSDDYNFFHPWLGTGLLTSDGTKWKKHRRALTPAFHFQILEQFIEIFESCSNILVSKFEKNLEKDSFDAYPYVTLCSLDVICESIMGIKINAQNDKDSDYVKSVKNMCRIVMERSMSLLQMHDWLYPLSKNYWTQRTALKILHKQSNEIINARRKELEKQPKNNNKNEEQTYFKNKKAFLDLLLQAEIDGIPLTNEEIREEVDTFMFEGHDTTSSAISFTLFCLANNPGAQNKAYEEQEDIFQGRENEAASYTDLQNMKYLEQVIKESLRLYPSVPFYGRNVTEDVPFGDSFIPKGITLGIFAFAIQRNPDYFENPSEFRPERFENADGKLPYAFVPFSAGPRNCIGQKFAMLEMKCIVSKILRQFQLLPARPAHKLQLLAETILKSANGIKIAVSSRNT